MPTMLNTLDWGNWLYGLLTGCISGGASAVYTAILAGAIDSHFAVGNANSFKLMGGIFAMSFIKDAALYLKQNPLPKMHMVAVETVERTAPNTVVTTTETTLTQEPPK